MIGSISGIAMLSLAVLLRDGNKPWCPLGDGLWKDVLKRDAPEKDGAAMPGEWARLGWMEEVREIAERFYPFHVPKWSDKAVVYTYSHLKAAMLDMLGE